MNVGLHKGITNRNPMIPRADGIIGFGFNCYCLFRNGQTVVVKDNMVCKRCAFTIWDCGYVYTTTDKLFNKSFVVSCSSRVESTQTNLTIEWFYKRGERTCCKTGSKIVKKRIVHNDFVLKLNLIFHIVSWPPWLSCSVGADLTALDVSFAKVQKLFKNLSS